MNVTLSEFQHNVLTFLNQLKTLVHLLHHSLDGACCSGSVDDDVLKDRKLRSGSCQSLLA